MTVDPRAEVRRKPQRASYESDAIHGVLDEALVCHLGFVVDGRPFVIPTTFARRDDELLVHGSPASRMLKHFDGTNEACLTVTILDGVVLAKSAFNHSMNYRSVVCFGRPAAVEDHDAKVAALDAITDRLAPGRRESLRPMTDKEVGATLVLSMPIEAASLKSRSGPSGDTEDWDVWTGVIPYALVPGDPIPD